MAEQTYGGFWIRFLAYLVDSVVIFSAVIVLAFLAAFLGDLGMTLIPVICLATPTLYWALMQASPRQATVGKALLGMKVTDMSGNRISLLRSLGRELAKIVSGIPLGLGYVMIAFTGRKQALHDMVAATTVTRESSGHVLVAVLMGVFGWIIPAGLAMFIGGALIAVMMGTMGAGVLGQMAQTGGKNIPVKTAAAPAPRPAPKATPSPTPPVAPTAPAAPPSPAPAAPVAAAPVDRDIEVALKTRLEGFDKAGTANAGPAVLEFYPSLGSRLRLKSNLPPVKELEGTKLKINLKKVLDAKGVELSDPNNRMDQGASLLRAEYEPTAVLAGMHVIQLKGGTTGEAATRVEGVLVMSIPTGRSSVSFAAGNVGKPQAAGGVQITLREIKGKDAIFNIAGDAAKVVYASATGAEDKPVQLETSFGKSDAKGGSMTYSFATPPAKIELVVADRFAERPFSFVLTKDAMSAKPELEAKAAAPVPTKPDVAAPPPEPKIAELPKAAMAAAPVVVAPSVPGPKYNDLMTAVMVADAAALRELLAFGKWPDKPDSQGVTPLMAAAMRGDRESAELLLKAGADPDRALAVSRQRGDPAMTTLLERYSATSKRP